MRKHKLIFSLMLIVSLGVFFTSCKEEEVEKKVENTERIDDLRAELRQLELDVLGAQKTLDLEKLDSSELISQIEQLKEDYDKVVKYTVTVVDLQGKLLEGITVITNQGGTTKEGTTNSEGRVTFDDMRGGIVAVVVKHESYATANYTASLYSGSSDYRSYGATTRVLMFPLAAALSDENMTTYTGKLFYNQSVQDDTLGGSAWDADADPSKWAPRQFNWTNVKYNQVTKADNVPVSARLVLDGIPTGSTNTGIGYIIAIAYEDAVYTGTWNDDNSFTIKIPARSIYDDWFEFDASFGEFTKSVTFNVNNASPTAKPENYPGTYTEDRIFRLDGVEFDSDLPGEVLSNDQYFIYSSEKF